MVGYAADLMFFKVPDRPNIVGLNWRLMMASAMIPAVIVCCFVFLCPESPRWYMSKGRHFKAYQSMVKLRFNKVQAARDVFYMHTLLEVESEIRIGRNKLVELVSVPRNRRALIASEIVMFMQQVGPLNSVYFSLLTAQVLWGKHYRILFVPDFPQRWFQPGVSPERQSRVWDH